MNVIVCTRSVIATITIPPFYLSTVSPVTVYPFNTVILRVLFFLFSVFLLFFFLSFTNMQTSNTRTISHCLFRDWTLQISRPRFAFISSDNLSYQRLSSFKWKALIFSPLSCYNISAPFSSPRKTKFSNTGISFPGRNSVLYAMQLFVARFSITFVI